LARDEHSTTVSYGPEKGEGPHDERLMNLFRNRVELKRAFLEQQSERDHLREQLRNQEASTRRAEERLEAMEQLLSKPEAGHSALVYFQLRSVWKASHEQLHSFAGQLFKQQEDRARRKQIMRFNQERDRRLSDLSDVIREARAQVDRRKADLDAARLRLDAATGFLRLFHRRRLRAEMAQLESDWESARDALEQLFDKRIKIESEPWPEFPGLNVEAKRAVNIAIIALAQHLYVHFSENDIARMARDAATRPIQDIKYGSEQDCKYLMTKIQELLAQMRDGSDWAREIKSRAQALRRQVSFRSERETVPMAGSLTSLPVAVGAGNFRQTVSEIAMDVNVLSEEYWDLYQAFVA
jgi:predicted nuclease with TOPRIM domain